MHRILVVEDNKTLAKLIAKQIHTALEFAVDVAYNLAEAKLYLQKYDYLVTLLDVNLPDAPNGEVIDYVLSKNQRVIVLSANENKTFRDNMLKKQIIDYVNKTGAENIRYIIHLIRRLVKNQEHKVMVVDDSVVFRKTMEDMLSNLFFNVISVAHGEEALKMLEIHPDTSLVLIDYFMPVMNGLELTKEIRKKFTHNDLSIIALSANEEEHINALFLKNGANDYIKKPFSKEEFSCRINNSIEALENIHLIINHANRDFLTGLYNRRYFFKHANEYFNQAVEEQSNFTIAMIDIDNFKYINDTYGHDAGDEVIVSLSEIARSSVNQNDIVARFGGEEFCIMLRNISTENALSTFERLRNKVENTIVTTESHQEITYTVSIGLALEPEESLDETINKADMMLYNAKQNGKNQIQY